MKIDIHTHTKKCKSGDAPSRNISPESFCEAILSSEVRIVAITNHNAFDLDQFIEIESRIASAAQVWPGIELDILEGESIGHLLVIVSPTLAKSFSEAVIALTKRSNPDRFTATIEEVLKHFDSLKPVYVAHYKQKRPSLSDDAREKLIAGTKKPGCVIKEVTNSISAGIYISHGNASIYGSDVQDWAKYEELSRELPDLRLPVDSFEHFSLLLEKDPTTINTVLDRKTSEDLDLCPFEDSTNLKFRVFNDINVIFGPKGTGKSCILRAIAKHYADNGIDAKIYESGSEGLNERFDVKGKDLKINLNDHGIDYCNNAIESLRSATEVDVTSLRKYVDFLTATNSNRNAQKLLLKNIDPEEESGPKREFTDFNDAVGTTRNFLTFLDENSSIKKELNTDEHEQIRQILTTLIERLKTREWTCFSDWKEICFLNSAIRVFRKQIERKTGSPAKPTATGFRDYAMNRMKIGLNAAAILKSVDTHIPVQEERVGSLGLNKGELTLRTEFEFQSGVLDGSFSSLTGTKKSTQKQFVGRVRKVLKLAYADSLFGEISELNGIEDVESIKTVYELLLFRRYFTLDGVKYTPSTGEASMVMLQKELGTDKDVYILDEPEKSLGNEYISDVIVPLIKERARSNKKVFISTHDANIAVRTLPYSSIYRAHDRRGYSTYIGNPFSNNLVNLNDANDLLDWKKVSMKTLEGGEEAFGERGRIYGKD